MNNVHTPHVTATSCPACAGSDLRPFYDVHQTPVHCVLLMPTQDIARSYPKGDIVLTFCRTCGFIFNSAFEAHLLEYSDRYEETQGYSATFQTFHCELAQDLIHRHHLRRKRLLEIGCGKGEFLNLLCSLGPNTGVGFDPSYIPGRNPDAPPGAVFIADFYSEKYASQKADLVCCKMTLEHIPDVLKFMRTVRAAIGHSPSTVVFFQVPNTTRLLDDLAFWDIYYEHCSYFTAGSLARLFQSCGFAVERIQTQYRDQYLMIEARPTERRRHAQIPAAESVAESEVCVNRFVGRLDRAMKEWREMLELQRLREKRVAVWGGGSKCVSFLSTLGLSDEVGCIVDINPHKQGTYLPGTGHRICSPAELKEFDPALVVVMNPVYKDEIGRDLRDMGAHAEMLTV